MADGEVMGSLTDLPEGIIHHILSFLPTKEATKTSILSKAWLRAARTRPVLDFCFEHTFVNANLLGNPTERKTKYREGFEFVFSTLQRYNEQKIGLEKFVLITETDRFDSSHLLDQCIELAAKNRPRGLHLRICFRDLPQSVFESKSLVNLYLDACRLKHQKVECRNLKGLDLDVVSLDEEIFGNIITSCQLIETLEIRNCEVIRDLKVRNLHNLKRLIVRLNAFQSVEVEGPNLECVHCINDGGDHETGLMGPGWINFPASEYENLKELFIGDMEICDNFFVNLDTKFPRLEDISIQHCQNLQRIKISSHSLKKIELSNCNGLEEAHFDVPRIVIFEYGVKCGEENVTFPRFSFTAASGKWASRIKLECIQDVYISLLLKLKEFLARLNQSEICVRAMFIRNVAFNAAEVTNSDALSEIEEIGESCFFFFQYPELNLSSILAILNGIFWICRPRTITMEWIGQPNARFTKLVYEMLVLKSIPDHSNFQQINFWQSNLKRVKDIEIFQGDAGVSFKGRRSYPSRIRKVVQLLEALDWGGFWKVLNAVDNLISRWSFLSFNLEWRSCDLRLEAKRLKLA